MMFTGKTKSGFTYCIPEKRIQNMELLDALTELETNGAALPKVVNLLLDANAKQKLYDHVRDEDGTVPVEAVATEIYDIFQNGDPVCVTDHRFHIRKRFAFHGAEQTTRELKAGKLCQYRRICSVYRNVRTPV